MRGVRLQLPRICAGCLVAIAAGALVAEDVERKGVVFHSAVCRAIYEALQARRDLAFATVQFVKVEQPPT